MDGNKTLKIISWNINTRPKAWDELVAMDADVGLIQESRAVPESVRKQVSAGKLPDFGGHYDRWPLVVGLSNRVDIEHLQPANPFTGDLGLGRVGVSDPSTIALARIQVGDQKPFIAASLYARWIRPRPETKSSWGVGYQDASIHRALSDLSAFIGSINPARHRILLAGDFNTIWDVNDTSLSLPARDDSIGDRLSALGFEFLGPKQNLPRATSAPIPLGDPQNTPTYYTSRQKPDTANRQLDYVFASRGFHEQISVRALNRPGEWGSSDHCRLLIEVKS